MALLLDFTANLTNIFVSTIFAGTNDSENLTKFEHHTLAQYSQL